MFENGFSAVLFINSASTAFAFFSTYSSSFLAASTNFFTLFAINTTETISEIPQYTKPPPSIWNKILPVSTKLNMTIKPTIMKSGPEFLRKKGEKVKINVQVSPHKKVRVGIRGTYKTYIETSSTGTVTFVVKEAGQYRFFVENKSDSTVRVVGTYSK